MEKGYSKKVDSLFRFLDNEEIDNIKEYIASDDREYLEYKNVDAIDFFNEDYSGDDISIFRSYSGYIYQYVNNAINGSWDYSYDGDEKFKNRCLEIGRELNEILLNSKNLSSNNFKVFRGVPISFFKEYGIEIISELINLNNKYLFDYGFTSTSFLRDTSYFKKEIPDGVYRNVLIEYDVPRDFNEGVYLKNNDLSYSVSQNEFLINSESLGYVYDVLLNEDSAILKVKLIPKRVYRKDYRNLIENSTIRKKLYTSF